MSDHERILVILGKNFLPKSFPVDPKTFSFSLMRKVLCIILAPESCHEISCLITFNVFCFTSISRATIFPFFHLAVPCIPGIWIFLVFFWKYNKKYESNIIWLFSLSYRVILQGLQQINKVFLYEILLSIINK